MPPFRRLAAAALAGSMLLSLPVAADEADFFDRAERFLRRLATQYAVLALRTQMDLTYDSLAIDPRSGDAVLTGVKAWPIRRGERLCEVDVERVRLGDQHSLDRLRSLVQVSGVRVPGACFEPPVRALMASFGFESVEIDGMTADLRYDFPGSTGSVTVQAAVRDAGDLSIDADFDYLYLRAGTDTAAMGGDALGPSGPVGPVAVLSNLEIAFENDGLFQRVTPLIESQVGEVAAIPEAARAALTDMLTEGGSGELSADQKAFVDRLAAGLERFVREQDRLVISARPQPPVLLTAELLADPVAALAALQPDISAATRARRSLVPPDELAAALAGGEGLSDARRLEIGRALATGEGAPRSPAAAADLLAPLAEGWDGEANLLLARAADAAGQPDLAYDHALRAMAAGARGAIGLGDALEAKLPLAAVLEAQGAAAEARPEALRTDETALLTAPRVGALRAHAADLAAGSGAVRDYAGAYFWASLAAAAGDAVSAALMSRLDEGFADDPDAAAWAGARAAAAARALETWTGGLGAALAAGE